MLRYDLPDLPPEHMVALLALQQRVDAKASLEEAAKTATAAFSQKRPVATFEAIKAALRAAAPPGKACFYCERDRHRDIEHIYPKRFYPDRAFRWSNFVYSCTICNQDLKKERFATFIGNSAAYEEFDRRRPYAAGTPTGDALLIDLRHENPFDFLRLDLSTGGFAPVSETGRDRARAIFTRDLLGLNADDLRLIRRQAFVAFSNYLSRAREAFAEDDKSAYNLVLGEILQHPHPTVLVEMRRQSPANEQLGRLFAAVPDHIGRVT